MTFFLDENLPERVALALDALEGADGNIVKHTALEFGKGVQDPDLIPKIKKCNGILITNDDKMKSRKQEYEIIREEGVSVFFISLPKGAPFELKYKTIINKWEEIKKICRKNKHPFMCKIKMRGETDIW